MLRKIRIVLIAVIMLTSCLLSCLIMSNFGVVYASDISVVGGYTNVLDDLMKDETFNAEDYPVIEDDYSLQVIQIAESSDNELFVYVYQPCSPNEELKATSIKLSTQIGQNLNYLMYDLSLINFNGCFYKYRVEDFVVSKDLTRYYDISAIHRLWDEKYDESLPETNENIISETPFVVGKEFTFTTSEKGIEISYKDVDVIEITDKYVGFCRYTSGREFPIGTPTTDVDAHFVAFSTNRDIDRLMEADVFYRTQKRTLRVSLGIIDDEDFGSIKDNYAYLKYTDKVEVTPDFGDLPGRYTYSWDRIQTIEDFLNSEDREWIYNGVVFNSSVEVKLTDDGLKDLNDMQWVLRFVETEYSQEVEGTALLSPYEETQTLVSDVSILRLAFETDGVYYNLGVVDNMQTGDGNPDNYTKFSMELTDMFKIILSILLLVVILVVAGPCLPIVFTILTWIIKIVFKVLIWIISLPIKLIGWIFKE